MATSSSDDFTATRDEIIKDSLCNVGAIGPNDDPDGDQYAHGSRLLNDLVKSIDARGQFLWRVTRASTATVASTASYALSATYLDLDQPLRFIKSGESDASLIHRITRDEYQALSDQTEESRVPTLFYTEKNLGSDGRVQMTLYLWPVPSTTGDAVHYAAFTRGEDFDTGAHTADFPQAWVMALKFGLSHLLAMPYRDTRLSDKFKALYEDELNRQLQHDNERGDLTYVPYGTWGNYAYGGDNEGGW